MPEATSWPVPPAVIAALIAALAAIGAALLNAMFNRQRDARTERRNAQSIAAAFAAEVGILARLSRERSEFIEHWLAEGSPTYDAAIARHAALPAARIWSTNASRVGELPVDLAGYLAAFHMIVVEIEQQCRIYDETDRDEMTPSEMRRLGRWFNGPARLGHALFKRLTQFSQGKAVDAWPKEVDLDRWRGDEGLS